MQPVCGRMPTKLECVSFISMTALFSLIKKHICGNKNTVKGDEHTKTFYKRLCSQ